MDVHREAASQPSPPTSLRSGDGPSGQAPPVSTRQHVESVLDEVLDHADGEPAVRFHLRCPARVRGLFYDTGELARRMTGEALGMAAAAEAIAAEALSGAPRPVAGARSRRGEREEDPRVRTAPPPRVWPHDPPVRRRPGAGDLPAIALERRESPRAVSRGVHTGAQGAATRSAPSSSTSACVLRCRHSAPSIARSAFSSMLFAAGACTGSPVSGRSPTTCVIVSASRHGRLRALMAAARVSSHCAVLSHAYGDGDLTRLQVLTMRPSSWARPRRSARRGSHVPCRVTLRRLADEVGWVLARRDAGIPAPLQPPPLDARLEHGTEWHIGAHAADDKTERHIDEDADGETPEWHIGADVAARNGGTTRDAALMARRGSAPANPSTWRSHSLRRPRSSRSFAPHSVPSRCRRPSQRGNGAPACSRTSATPGKRSRAIVIPSFERDGWQCQVPACSGRRHLHDHHIHFRSRGGDNRRTNRITVCAWHHLRAIHAGYVRGWAHGARSHPLAARPRRQFLLGAARFPRRSLSRPRGRFGRPSGTEARHRRRSRVLGAVGESLGFDRPRRRCGLITPYGVF